VIPRCSNRSFGFDFERIVDLFDDHDLLCLGDASVGILADSVRR